jgi:hypothetical protein
MIWTYKNIQILALTKQKKSSLRMTINLLATKSLKPNFIIVLLN